MTALSIAQNAANEIGIPLPTTLAGSTQPEAQKLLRYCNKVGTQLMKVFAWQRLRAGTTFPALNQLVQTGIFPSDFDRIVPDTMWNRSTTIQVKGPISDVDWETLRAQNLNNINFAWSIYRNNAVEIYPVQAAGNTIAFTYVKNTWAISATGSTPATSFTMDGDTTVLDEELITRGVIYQYLYNDGQPWQNALQDYEDYFDLLASNDQPSTDVLITGDIFARFSRYVGGTPGGNQVNLGETV